MDISSIIVSSLPQSITLADAWSAIMPLTQTAVFLILSASLSDYLRHRSRIVRLSEIRPPLPPHPTPKLNIGVVVPAKDEESRVHIGLRSIVHSTGLNSLRIVAVNDRSIDHTPALMNEVAQEVESKNNPNISLNVLNITELPAGWLGKTNACWLGAQSLQESAPEYLLFTDADVVFHDQALFEAALHMKAQNLDFLTVFPNPEFSSRIEAAFLLFFAAVLNLFTKPWLLSKPGGKAHMGIGAFIMVRADAYFKLEGHKSIKLNITEDLKLSLLFRAAGLKCAAARAGNRINIRWGTGLLGTLKGLIKNIYASYDYSLFKLCFGSLALAALFISPWLSLPLDHFSMTLGATNLVMILIIYRMLAKELRTGWFVPFLLSPMMCLLLTAISAASAISITRHGGVLWRNSFYPLIDLKRALLTPKKAFKSGK